MNIAVLNTQIPFCFGGAEMLADDLINALNERGHKATLVSVPFKWFPQQSLLDSIIASKLLGVGEFNDIEVDLTIALRFPAWLMSHDNMALWICHQHRSAYDLWDTEYCDIAAMRDSTRIRDLIRREDSAAIAGCERVFSISKTVADRLKDFNQLDSGVLYPPPREMERFSCAEYGDFFFFPSRINPLKRQELVIEALAHTGPEVKVVFAGPADSAEYEESLKQRAEELGLGSRVIWLGQISEEAKLDLYARCKMVIFPPHNEDYGYISPEAMLSSKGVVTVEDAGGALEFVRDGETGCVAPVDAQVLAQTLQDICASPNLAAEYGANARTAVDAMDLSWDRVTDSLLGLRA